MLWRQATGQAIICPTRRLSAARPLLPESMEAIMRELTHQTPRESDLARLIVKTLNLEIAPADILPEAPLFGEGLGLDSIDVLEIALAISQTNGVQLRSDDENNKAIFRSLRTLNDHIHAHGPG